MNKIKTFSILVSSTILMSSIASVTASAVYDNNGNPHHYVGMASRTISNPRAMFPSGNGTVSAAWVPIYKSGGVIWFRSIIVIY